MENVSSECVQYCKSTAHVHWCLFVSVVLWKSFLCPYFSTYSHPASTAVGQEGLCCTFPVPLPSWLYRALFTGVWNSGRRFAAALLRMLQRSQAWLRLLETAELALPYRRCSQRGQAHRASPARPRGSPLNALWKWWRGLRRAASTEPNISWHTAWPITSGAGSTRLRSQQRASVSRSEGAAASLSLPGHSHWGQPPPKCSLVGQEVSGQLHSLGLLQDRIARVPLRAHRPSWVASESPLHGQRPELGPAPSGRCTPQKGVFPVRCHWVCRQSEGREQRGSVPTPRVQP